jgi:hypothetical protein
LCGRILTRRRGRLEPRPARRDAGFAAIDALVALTIFATTIVFATAALHTAGQGSTAALEARQAKEALAGAIERASTNVGASQGEGPRFAWALTVHPPFLTAGGIALCEQEAVVTAKASGRKYRLASGGICPMAAPS